MPERFMRGIEVVNGIVWGPVGLGLLFGTGLLLTVRTGGFQLRRWGYWMRHTLGAILTDQSVTAHTAREEQAISQFQSLCTALASTIGTGNLVGVSTAILSGGAGAVFWMWVMALLGMMTSYAENVLGIYYRRKDPAGAAGRCTTCGTAWAASRGGCWRCYLPRFVRWQALASAT